MNEDLINQARNQSAELMAFRLEQEQERKRQRTLKEAQFEVNYWIRQHKRKTKTPVKISVVREYVSEFDKMFYVLRLFLGSELKHIYNLEEEAGRFFTENKEPNTVGGLDFYTIYSNM